MIKKLFLLTIFILVAISTIVTGVFAWFYGIDDAARVKTFDASVRPEVELSIETNTDEIFLGDRLRDLVYITDANFHTLGFDFYGYASFFEVRLNNPTNSDALTRISLQVQASPEFGALSGSQAGLKYLVLNDKNDLSSTMYSLQTTSDVYAAMSVYNSQGVLIPANSTTTVYVAVWGFFDGLTSAQQQVYHALVYRVKFVII
ncbi:MAG TPA: hypothetical protein VIK67_03485 [Acholeplasma sp.]|jgi:hypothetical protein